MDVVEVDTDTCDACGARSYVFADMHPGSLSFCSHHGTVFLPRLHEIGATVIDLRHTVPA